MKTTQENIKKVKASMRNIARLLNNYALAEDYQPKTRNGRDYDNCTKTMQVNYDDIMRNLNDIVLVTNTLGCSCNRLDIKEMVTLHKISF